MMSSQGTPPFDWNTLQPKPNNWLQIRLMYEGRGTAELKSPRGTIAGSFVAQFDEHGSSLVKTTFETLSRHDAYNGPDVAFILFTTEQQPNGETAWHIGLDSENPCESLTFSAEGGTFVSTGKVDWAGYTLGPETSEFRFSVREGKFETENTNPAKYFAIPLLNCIVELKDRFCVKHPLRIFPTPSIPDSVPANMYATAELMANQRNSVLAFTVSGMPCFVERMPDYEASVATLKSGAAQHKITAVLVGEVGSNPVDTLADFKAWFPFETLSVLSFASGVEVGLPWIEIRDEQGRLIRRLHGGTLIPSYFEGDDVFHKQCRPGAGDFLVRFLHLPEEKKVPLRVVMNHARLGSLGTHLHLHDVMDHLVRALECLCREHKLTQQNLMSGLSSDSQNKLTKVVNDVRAKLKRLGDMRKSAGDMNDYRLLTTITSRAASMAQTENKLGLAVVDLLKKFGLTDADVADVFLSARNRPDWASLISIYRNATIHEGYLDFSKRHDVDEVVQLCLHLKDVLTRLILKECGYDGTYDSVLRRSYGPQSIDWVVASTNPAELGYK
jgi:hypothetical protein